MTIIILSFLLTLLMFAVFALIAHILGWDKED